MATPPIYRDPLDGTEMIRVLKGGRFYMAPVTAVLDLLGMPAALAPLVARLSAAETALAAQAARLAILEARPEEVAHFTATAPVPALSILGGGTVTLTKLIPAKSGDVLRAGEDIAVRPTAALPNGAGIAAARVTADGVVTVQLVTSVAVSAGQTITWAITALR